MLAKGRIYLYTIELKTYALAYQLRSFPLSDGVTGLDNLQRVLAPIGGGRNVLLGKHVAANPASAGKAGYPFACDTACGAVESRRMALVFMTRSVDSEDRKMIKNKEV